MRALVLGVWVAGCSGDLLDDGNQTGQIAPPCCDCGDSISYALGDVGPGGFSAADALAGLGAFDGDVQWSDGPSATLHVALSEDTESVGSLQWIEPYDVDNCEPFFEVPIWLSVSTSDGALDETQRSSLIAYAPDRGKASADWYGDVLAGSLDLSRFVPSVDDSSAIVYFHLETDGGKASGTVELNPQDESGSAGWDGAQPIATWSE